jgi:hypothetical protein
MLRNVDWWLFTEFSVQHIDPIFMSQAGQEILDFLALEAWTIGCTETSANSYQSNLRKIPDK